MPSKVRTRADDVDKHTADVNTLIYHKGKLYSGADDGKIKVWEEDLKKVTEIDAHPTTVYCLAASEDSLYSCSNDGTIKAWNLNDLQSKGTIFEDKEVEIYRLSYSNGCLFSSDEQGVIRCHEGKKQKSVYNLLEPLKELIVVDKLMYTVRDLDVVITELVGDESASQMKGTLMGRAPMCIAGDKLCFSSRGGKDILVHENSLDSQFKLVAEVKDAHEMIINSIVGAGTTNQILLYSAGWDKIVKQWKIEGDVCTLIDSCNADVVVNVLAYGEKGEIYAGGSDGHIVRIDV